MLCMRWLWQYDLLLICLPNHIPLMLFHLNSPLLLRHLVIKTMQPCPRISRTSESEINELSLHLRHTDPDNAIGEPRLNPAILSNMAYNQQHPGFDANLAAS